nr:uncharacterized protein I203_00030 [Kwoniella mangroviensis CBS 8507]OCF69903.1 hypothetical protein I203_00030 [Kwoniella mangroviensis CBS 8507]
MHDRKLDAEGIAQEGTNADPMGPRRYHITCRDYNSCKVKHNLSKSESELGGLKSIKNVPSDFPVRTQNRPESIDYELSMSLADEEGLSYIQSQCFFDLPRREPSDLPDYHMNTFSSLGRNSISKIIMAGLTCSTLLLCIEIGLFDGVEQKVFMGSALCLTQNKIIKHNFPNSMRCTDQTSWESPFLCKLGMKRSQLDSCPLQIPKSHLTFDKSTRSKVSSSTEALGAVCYRGHDTFPGHYIEPIHYHGDVIIVEYEIANYMCGPSYSDDAHMKAFVILHMTMCAVLEEFEQDMD